MKQREHKQTTRQSLRAMILAAGFGKRFLPLTANTPKPLISVAGRALIDYAIDTIKTAGITQCVINTHYLADQMHEYIKALRQSGLEVQESFEPEPLETGGGIKQALPLLGPGPFIALNSDTICVPDASGSVLAPLLAQAEGDVRPIQLLLTERGRAIGYDGPGDFVIDAGQSRLRRRREGEIAPYVFTGIQWLKPELFAQAPEGAFSMNHLYNSRQDAEGWLEDVGFALHKGDWLHVGDRSGLSAAEAYFASCIHA